LPGDCALQTSRHGFDFRKLRHVFPFDSNYHIPSIPVASRIAA
jgi:hypothetical protein